MAALRKFIFPNLGSSFYLESELGFEVAAVSMFFKGLIAVEELFTS